MRRIVAQITRVALFVGWLTTRRVRTSWWLTLASGFGVLLAVTVVAVAIIHSNTLAKAGFRYILSPGINPGIGTLGLTMVIPDRPLGRKDYDTLGGVVEEAVLANLGELPRIGNRLGLTQRLPYSFDSIVVEQDSTTYLFFQEGFEEHVRLVSGRFTEPSALSGGPIARMEVLIGFEAAQILRLTDGSQLALIPFERELTEQVVLTVVGVVEAIDPADPYWFQDPPRLALEEEEESFVAPFYVSEADFFNVMGVRYPMLLGDYWWYVALDVDSLDPASAGVARRALDSLEAEVNRTFPRSYALSGLGGVVTEFERDVAIARVPLFLFTFLVVGVVLYYLALLSWMMAYRRGSEAAMLRSRGASTFQVGVLLGLGEGLVVAVPAVAVGPFLALAIARSLPVGDVDLGQLSVGLSPSVFLLAAAVGLACIAVFVASGLGVAGQSIIQFLRERARPTGRAALYRYSIDLLILAAIGMVWWQISGRGGFITRRVFGEGVEADLTLLVGPALVLLGVGLAMLRMLPYVLRLLARLTASIRSVWLVYGLSRMARDPLRYGAMAVLLMMATALGSFGATFGPTLIQTETDRVRYEVGGEIVLRPTTQIGSESLTAGRRIMEGMEEIDVIVPLDHAKLDPTGSSRGAANAKLLVVESPPQLLHTAWFRRDFADVGLEEVLRPLEQPINPQFGIVLPDGAERIGVWVRPEHPSGAFTLWARFRDTEANFEIVDLGKLGFTEWTYMEGAFPERVHLRPPYTLVAFYITGPLRSFVSGGSLALDEVNVVVDGVRQVVEPFEEAGQWQVMPNLDAAVDVLTFASGAAPGANGTNVALLEWTFPIGNVPRGILTPPVRLPIPVVGSTSFTSGQVITGRVGAQAITLEVKGVLEYFPTLNPTDGPFLIIDLETLNQYQGILLMPRPVLPSQFWLAPKEGVSSEAVVAALEGAIPPENVIITDRESAAEDVLADPLAGGAWRGLAMIGLGTLLGVSSLGYVLYAALIFQRIRLELGLVRALGFTRRQVGLMLGLEGLVVAAVGIGVGFAVGSWLGGWILNYFDVTIGGQSVVPPMILGYDTRLLALTYGGVVAAAATATVLALVLAARLRPAEVLRVEE